MFYSEIVLSQLKDEGRRWFNLLPFYGVSTTSYLLVGWNSGVDKCCLMYPVQVRSGAVWNSRLVYNFLLRCNSKVHYFSLVFQTILIDWICTVVLLFVFDLLEQFGTGKEWNGLLPNSENLDSMSKIHYVGFEWTKHRKTNHARGTYIIRTYSHTYTFWAHFKSQKNNPSHSFWLKNFIYCLHKRSAKLNTGRSVYNTSHFS